MMTSQERTRIEDKLPSTVDVAWSGVTETYNLTPFWSGNDVENPDYPQIVFSFDTRGEETDAPLGDVARIEKAGENDFRKHKESEQADAISVTIAVNENWRNDQPPQVRVEQIAEEIWNLFRFGIDVNSLGPNGERAMTLDSTQAPTGPNRVAETLRIEWVVEANYTSVYTETEDTVAGADTETTIN